MSEKDKAVEDIAGGKTQVISWLGLGQDENGKAVNVANAVFKTVQFQGTFDGGAIQLEGSLDGQNFHTLTDPQGNMLRKSANSIEMAVENVVWIRPFISGGGKDTKIDVRLLIKFER